MEIASPLANQGGVFCGIALEFFDAAFAAERDFAAFVYDDDRFAHAAEFFARDNTGAGLVGLFVKGQLEGKASDQECGSEGGDVSAFHAD